jgi:hypothetical protein
MSAVEEGRFPQTRDSKQGLANREFYNLKIALKLLIKFQGVFRVQKHGDRKVFLRKSKGGNGCAEKYFVENFKL